jgi:hypothetical protein
MSKKDGSVNRRDFFKIGTGAAAASLFGGRVATGEDEPPAQSSRVVLIRDQTVISDDGAFDGELLHTMLNRAVQSLFEEDSTEADADGPSGRKGTESWIDSRTFW